MVFVWPAAEDSLCVYIPAWHTKFVLIVPWVDTANNRYELHPEPQGHTAPEMALWILVQINQA